MSPKEKEQSDRLALAELKQNNAMNTTKGLESQLFPNQNGIIY